jgi:hypothetical protein
VRAELTIAHEQGDLVSALEQVFGENEAAALHASALAQKSPSSAASITYSAYGPGLLVMAWPTPRRLFLYVESSGGRLRKASADVWDVIIDGGRQLKPKLKSLVLLDEDANDEIALAAVGLAANIKRPELYVTAVTGILTAMVLVVAIAAFGAAGDLLIGSIPALVAAILALGWLINDVRSKKLVWQ